MKVRILGDVGVELIAEDDVDRAIIRRFWKGGVKVNSITNTDQEMSLTFAELIKVE